MAAACSAALHVVGQKCCDDGTARLATFRAKRGLSALSPLGRGRTDRSRAAPRRGAGPAAARAARARARGEGAPPLTSGGSRTHTHTHTCPPRRKPYLLRLAEARGSFKL